MAKPSLPSIKLSSPATIIPPIKQEPLQSPPSPPPPNPILPPLTVAAIYAAIKQELLQSPLSLPPPEPIAPPLAVVKNDPEEPILPEQRQEQLQQEQQQQPQFLKSIADLASLSKALNAFNCKFDYLTKHLDSINQAIDSKFNEPPQQEQQIETQPSLKSTETEIETVKEGPKVDSPPKPSHCSIQGLCESMCTKGFRKYIVSNLSNVPKLREEIPLALKLAPEPAKLVLDCIGQFFLIGKRACTQHPHTILSKQALLLLLELFLSMRGSLCGESGIRVAVNVKVEAEKVAIGWRKRLNREGGLAKASETDATALLLYVACFGIPRDFRNEDLGVLLKLSNLRGISDALKASPLLPGKMPDIIDAMVKNGMHFEAVEVASIFGFKGKFSPKTILTSFLQESTKAFERAKHEAHNNPMVLIKANEKQLDALKSTVRYLEDCSSDVTELLGSWQVKENIVKLEEDIAELHKRIKDKKKRKRKRKQDKLGLSSPVQSQEVKRSRIASEGSPLPKPHVNQLCEQPTAVLVEGNGLISNSCNTNTDPFASAAPNGTTGPIPKNEIGQMGGTTGIGVIPASSCCGDDGEIEVKAGQMMSDKVLPYEWRQGFVPQSASMWFAGLFGSSPSVEGFVGLLDITVRTSADRYRFADSLA